ncbi:hypothetical protein niasHT_029192 [Heterodera trifolii]|uniref:Uncharacterized protein n=1 Tax=Heterodera trifolii TaxID=157864 RepID=A0ABD2JZT5_9BILA
MTLPTKHLKAEVWGVFFAEKNESLRAATEDQTKRTFGICRGCARLSIIGHGKASAAGRLRHRESAKDGSNQQNWPNERKNNCGRRGGNGKNSIPTCKFK